jgi:hypothetical protein
LIALWLVDGGCKDARALTLSLPLVLALAFMNTGGLLMLAFDFASYRDNVEAREVASKPLRTSRGDQEISPLERSSGAHREL